jgi:hypothetical protein
MAVGVALPGKFARFQLGSSAVEGAFRWNVGFRRERLDTTTFESDVSNSGNNLCSDGVTGVLDTTFQVEIYNSAAAINILYPETSLLCDLLFRQNVSLGYNNITADVLSFSPSTDVRGVSKGTAELQSNGLVSPAA